MQCHSAIFNSKLKTPNYFVSSSITFPANLLVPTLK